MTIYKWRQDTADDEKKKTIYRLRREKEDGIQIATIKWDEMQATGRKRRCDADYDDKRIRNTDYGEKGKMRYRLRR